MRCKVGAEIRCLIRFRAPIPEAIFFVTFAMWLCQSSLSSVITPSDFVALINLAHLSIVQSNCWWSSESIQSLPQPYDATSSANSSITKWHSPALEIIYYCYDRKIPLLLANKCYDCCVPLLGCLLVFLLLHFQKKEKKLNPTAKKSANKVWNLKSNCQTLSNFQEASDLPLGRLIFFVRIWQNFLPHREIWSMNFRVVTIIRTVSANSMLYPIQISRG